MYHPLKPISAPQIATREEFDALYRLWRRTNVGSLRAFCRFMVAPSAARDLFVAGARSVTVAASGVIIHSVAP